MTETTVVASTKKRQKEKTC